MASGRALSRRKIKDAIPNSGGVIARVAKKCGYSWVGVRDFIARDEELSAMMKDEEETIDDAAESTLIAKIFEGDESVARWWLARRRRNKFGDNIDVTSGGEQLKVLVEYVDNNETD